MSRTEKFEDLKKEVRSILLTYQNGCTISELNKEYRTLIGRTLPVYEFSFRSETELLENMPDVVQISYSYSGGNHYLYGIADKDTAHIQKMVCKQKSSKSKPFRAPPPIRSRPRTVPPRFQQEQSFGLKNSFQFSRKVPTLEVRNSTQSYRPEPSKTATAVPVKAPPPRDVPKPSPAPEKKLSTREEVISLVKFYKNGIPLSEILYEYEQVYGKGLDLSSYEFSSIEACIECIPELVVVYKTDGPYAVHESEAKRVTENSNSVDHSSSSYELNQSVSECRASRPYSRNSNLRDSSLSPTFLSQLKEVAKNYSHLIYSYEFPKFFEEITGSSLDLHKLGYKCLADFIDEVPEIFSRKSIAGMKNDYVIYPTALASHSDSHQNDNGGTVPLLGALLVQDVIRNLRQILQANPEGISLDQLEYNYKINCKGRLYAPELGFRDLETFLFSIKDQVPLICKSHNGMKKVYFVKFSDVDNGAASDSLDNYIPIEAASPTSKFKPLKFPKDFDASKYFPVYLAHVFDLGHFYVQLQDEKTPLYEKMSEAMDEFYNGEQSRLYIMKNTYIQVGTNCIALWPVDQHWYRTEILSIPAMDKVQVKYVDYGTKAEIPTSLLRYIKKDFLKLPVQAFKCCLSFLKPPKNAKTWSEASKKKFLALCRDVPLMAKIDDNKPDGTYAVLLCDTNGENNDLFINDELVQKNYAEIDLPEEEPEEEPPAVPIPTVAPPMPPAAVHPYQVYQAHQYLLLFASVLPSFSTNQHYLGLLQEVATLLSNAGPGQASLQPSPSPGLNYYAGLTNSNMLAAMYPPTPAASGGVPYDNSPIRAPTLGSGTAVVAAAENGVCSDENKEESDSPAEIFEDDDDDFEKFCQEVVNKCKRYVKRVTFSDGYKLHIINHDSKAYASSGEISQLIWLNKDDHLQKRLQIREVDYSVLILYEDGNEELFRQLQRCQVKGIMKSESENSILLYPLKVIIKILNDFGHPSALLRTELTAEISNFDPNGAIWKEPSVLDIVEQAEESMTDDDKIDKMDQLDRLCLSDLRAMKEGINQKRLKFLNASKLSQENSSSHVDEIDKLEKLQERVKQRMKEIQEICQLFS